MKNIKIGNIELRPSNSKKYIAEVVLWQPNKYYKHEVDYEWDEDGNWAIKKDMKDDEMSLHIHKACFVDPETCYVLSFINRFEEGDEPDITECGSRVVMLDDENLQDYINVCKLIFKYINKK